MKQLIFILFIFVLINACTSKIKVTTTASKVMFVNALPSNDSMHFTMDDKTLLVHPLPYLGNTYYREFIEGNRKIACYINGQKKMDSSITFVKNSNYSVFMMDYVSYLRALVLEDNATASANGNCKVRFVQLSPNIPSVKVIDKSTNNELCALGVLGTHSNFIEVAANTYELKLVDASNTTLYTSYGHTLEANKIYTIMVKGINGSTNMDSLGTYMIENSKY